jgi:ubiquinone biosynthesis protein
VASRSMLSPTSALDIPAARTARRYDDRRIATGALHQTLLAFLGAALGITAALLLDDTGGPRVTPELGLHQAIGYGLLTIGSLLVLRVLATILRPRR